MGEDGRYHATVIGALNEHELTIEGVVAPLFPLNRCSDTDLVNIDCGRRVARIDTSQSQCSNTAPIGSSTLE